MALVSRIESQPLFDLYALSLRYDSARLADAFSLVLLWSKVVYVRLTEWSDLVWRSQSVVEATALPAEAKRPAALIT